MSGRINFLLTEFENVTLSYPILAATDYTTATVKIVGKPNFSIFIQKIVLAVTTDNAAVQTFQDSSGTPLILAATKVSPGVGPLVFDFFTEGIQLPVGASFNHKMSAAGMAGFVYVQAYLRRMAPTAP